MSLSDVLNWRGCGLRDPATATCGVWHATTHLIAPQRPLRLDRSVRFPRGLALGLLRAPHTLRGGRRGRRHGGVVLVARNEARARAPPPSPRPRAALEGGAQVRDRRLRLK